jgi:sec-independent protein translocase protein TatC
MPPESTVEDQKTTKQTASDSGGGGNDNDDFLFEDDDGELGGAMSFLDHLGELRERLIKCVIAMVVATVICFIFANSITRVLMDAIPQGVEARVGGSPITGVMIWLKVSVVAGFFFAFPILFYQIWSFVAPGLYRKEKRFMLPLCISSWSCFIIGALFSYFVVFKFALQFLVTFEVGDALFLWDADQYLTFMLRFLVAFGVVFQEPVIIVLLAKMGIVDSGQLAKFRPYAYVLGFALAALITPPEVVSQIMCGVPMIILYEFSILLVRVIERRKPKEA